MRITLSFFFLSLSLLKNKIESNLRPFGGPQEKAFLAKNNAVETRVIFRNLFLTRDETV